jgi:hypothetical protein
MTVRYQDYKQFKSDINIKYDDGVAPTSTAPKKP